MKSTCVCFLFCSAALSAGVSLRSTAGAQDDKANESFVPLFDGKSLDAWKAVLADTDAKPADTWSITESGVLVCTGNPHGYVRTLKEYKNYVLKVDWRYIDNANGNSGVLTHCQMPDKVWPSCIEIQMHNPTAGTVFPLVDSKTDNESRARDKAKPVGQWNTFEITCNNGTIVVVLNGERVGEVTGATPAKGFIGLQSEGTEVHFRNVLIRELPSEPARE